MADCGAPVYAKHALRSALEVAWTDARAALESAERVVFFGYSLPAIDIEAEKLFERALFRNSDVSWIDVINPSPEAAGRFAQVSGSAAVHWYPTLTSFLATDDLT